MNEREQRKNELLKELSRQFEDNAAAMKKIATRIQDAAAKSMEIDRRLHSAGEKLSACVEGSRGALPFSYLEYMEFQNSQEFRKFREMPVVTDDDLRAVDIDDLCRRLQADE